MGIKRGRLNYIFNFTALWGAVIAGAVLGRIIDPPEPKDAEVFDSHPEILKEQLRRWSEEFFDKTTNYRYPSRTEVLEEFSRFGEGRSLNLKEISQYNGEAERLNTNRRHFNLNSLTFEGSRWKPKVKSENLLWMLQNVFHYPRNHNTNETAKEGVKNYIVDQMQITSGLLTAVQYFQPIQFLSMYEGSTIPMGANLIGILKGREWGTANDRPVLVGAHWDTVNFTPGTDDNGSGVAAMLETARAISHSGCRPKHSLIFVAFDLEEVGSQGSLIFIKEYLTEILKTNLPKETSLTGFQGAFIVDSIMNFNDSSLSQKFPRDWSLAVPEVYDEVADEGYKGDFLSMIFRKNIDNQLPEKFKYHWEQSSHDKKFKLKGFPLSLGKDLPSIDILADHLNFLRSDHSRFWYMNDTSVPHTLKAVLMTDTGPYRGNMETCYHSVCDGPELSVYNNPVNLKFLTKITQVLTNTMIDMVECQFDAQSQRQDVNNVSQNFIRTTQVHAKSSSYRHGSPLRNLLNFVRWMENSSS